MLNGNDAPTDILLNTTSVNENVAANSVIATLSSIDPNPNNTFTYSLVTGTGSTDNPFFSISDNQLKINTVPNFETKNQYSIGLRTTDQSGLSFQKNVILNVANRNEAPTFALLTDNFSAPDNPLTSNLNYNLTARQVGTLPIVNWVRNGDARVGNTSLGIDSGNYLRITNNGTAALDRNFNLSNSQGGLRIRFNLAPNPQGLLNQELGVSLSLGLSALNKNAAVNAAVPHFGIRFQGNGDIQAFDGNRDVTGSYSSWGGTGNDTTLHPFTLIATDPTDGNPFNGIGQTNIYVYSGKTLIYSYIKEGGGYRDNFINFSSNGTSGLDNLKIEKLGLVTFAENGTGTVYTATATDPNAGTTLTYSLAGTDANLFNLNSSTGAITFKNAPDLNAPADSGGDNIYDLIVTAFDGSLSASQSLAVLVTNTNEAPTNLALSNLSVNERVPANTIVGTFSSTDPDPGNPFVYTLVTGAGAADNSAFTIVGNQLQINNSPDLTLKSSYSIRVRTTDQGNLSFEKALTIGVNEINEAPTDLALSAIVVNENAANNTVVGTLTSTDPDLNNSFTYNLVTGFGSTDNASFNISGNQIRINTAPVTGKTSYSIRVQSTDQDGLSFEKILAISVNQTPTDLALSATQVSENIAANTVIGILSSSDPDPNDSFIYQLVSGVGADDNGAFTISNNTLKINSSPDFDTKPSYTLRVRTTDQNGLFVEKVLTINVNNINEAPTVTSSSTANFIENGTGVVYITEAIDPDAATTLTYSLAGTDANFFTIDSSTGLVSLNNALNFESPSDSNGDNIFDIIVRASDGSLSGSKAVALSLKNVNEAPTLTIPDSATTSEFNGVVFTITATDPDASDFLRYSLSGADAEFFEIDINERQIRFKEFPNFEAPLDSDRNNVYDITVNVTDNGNLIDSKAVAITVTDDNEAPTFSLLTDNFYAFNNSNTYNLNYNLTGRQSGILGTVDWISRGDTQVNFERLLGTHMSVDTGASAALNRNFSGEDSRGGLRIKFDLYPDTKRVRDPSLGVGISLGLSANDKNALIGSNVPHFGILFGCDLDLIRR